MHIIAALFFSLVFVGACVAIHLTVREYWAEILSALRGEVPQRTVIRKSPLRPTATSAAHRRGAAA